MDWIVRFLREELLEINSPWFVHEMKTLSRDESTQAFRADRGHHDDRICAMAFVLHSLHSYELVETDPSIAMDRIKRRFKGNVKEVEREPEEAPQDRTLVSVNVQPENNLKPSPQECDQYDMIPSEMTEDNWAEW